MFCLFVNKAYNIKCQLPFPLIQRQGEFLRSFVCPRVLPLVDKKKVLNFLSVESSKLLSSNSWELIMHLFVLLHPVKEWGETSL